MIHHRIALGLAALVCAASALFAQEAAISLGTSSFDKEQPVEVTADQLSVDQSTGHAVFDGNVLVVQGEMRMTAPQMTVIYSQNEDGANDGIEELVAVGGVTFVSPTDEAESDTANYVVETGFVTLTGNVLLIQGPNAISGDKLVVDLEAGTGVMEGRVRTIFNTQSNN